MHAVEGQVVWSHVAQAAFQEKLRQLETTMEQNQLENAVQRLRRTRRKHEGDDPEAERNAGSAWARTEATWPGLLSMHAAFADWTGADWGAFHTNASFVYADFENHGHPTWGPERLSPIHVHTLRIAGVIRPPDDRHNHDVERHLESQAHSFWAEHCPGIAITPDLVREFVEGAVMVYEQLRDRVEEG